MKKALNLYLLILFPETFTQVAGPLGSVALRLINTALTNFEASLATTVLLKIT